MPWMTVLTWAALIGAAAAWVVARRARRQAVQLADMYWRLRYDHNELKARLDRAAPEPGPSPQISPGTQFVPLSQVKR